MLTFFASRTLLLTALLCLPLAQGATIAYTDYASFLAAAGPQTETLSFASAYTATPPTTADYATADGVTVGGVKFIGGLKDIPGYYYLFVAGGGPQPGYLGDQQAALVGGFTSFTAGLANPYSYFGYLTLTFPYAINSVSFTGALDYGAAGAGAFQAEFSNGDIYSGNQPYTPGSAPQFDGFISTTPFTSLTIFPGAPAADFTDPIFQDNPTLYYTPVLEQVTFAQTPEPRGMFLLGIIFLLPPCRGLLSRLTRR